jgi:hypothetical protein
MSQPADGDVYVNEPWLYMWWDGATSCVRSEWKGFANSAEFRAGVMKGLEAIRERHATAYVSDTRAVKVIVQDDQRWARDVVAPLMAAAGLKRMAAVVANGGLGKVTVEEVLRMVTIEGMLVRSFHSMPEAMRWAGEG